MHYSDKEILSLFQHPESKEKAFRMLLNNYQEKLYYHVRRYVHTHDDAHDILQNTFIKVWKHLDQFREDASLYTWLYKIAGNEAITYIRKLNKLPTVEFEPTTDTQKGISDSMDEDSVIKKLEQAIDTLPEKQRQVFILRYYDEMPYEQMAAITDTSVGALKASYHHAVKKIEEILTS